MGLRGSRAARTSDACMGRPQRSAACAVWGSAERTGRRPCAAPPEARVSSGPAPVGHHTVVHFAPATMSRQPPDYDDLPTARPPVKEMLEIFPPASRTCSSHTTRQPDNMPMLAVRWSEVLISLTKHITDSCARSSRSRLPACRSPRYARAWRVRCGRPANPFGSPADVHHGGVADAEAARGGARLRAPDVPTLALRSVWLAGCLARRKRLAAPAHVPDA